MWSYEYPLHTIPSDIYSRRGSLHNGICLPRRMDVRVARTEDSSPHRHLRVNNPAYNRYRSSSGIGASHCIASSLDSGGCTSPIAS
jgi:hypothetical protein